MKLRRAVLAAFAAAAMTACGAGGVNGRAARVTSTTVPVDRPATEDERSFCEAHFDVLGPINNDCSRVVLAGEIQEDDPWGRWDCRVMGNRQCGSTLWFTVEGMLQGFDINDPHRPGCFVEPSNVVAGFEIIHYSRISGRGAPEFIGDPLGFEVRCP
jgi:hypothetical protein